MRCAVRAREYRMSRGDPTHEGLAMARQRRGEPGGDARRRGGSRARLGLLAVVAAAAVTAACPQGGRLLGGPGFAGGGAGPGGAPTARLLARAGVRVLRLARARFPRHKACSEYLSPATTAVLERLGAGVLEQVEGAAHAKLYGMKVVAPDGTAMCGRFTSGHGHAPPRPYSFALSRAAFDSILLRAAQREGAVVHQGVAVEDLLWDGGTVAGVVVRSGDGQRATRNASIVVGADGLHSVIARRLGLVRTSPPRRVAFTAHVADVAGVDGVGELHVGADGYVGLGPIGGGVTTVALVVPLARVQRRARDFRADFFAELERYPGLAGRFDRRRMVREVLGTGPFAQWSRRPVADGALLVGDAADFFDPFTGQGIYAALRGAELAADSLIPRLTGGADAPISATASSPPASSLDCSCDHAR